VDLLDSQDARGTFQLGGPQLLHISKSLKKVGRGLSGFPLGSADIVDLYAGSSVFGQGPSRTEGLIIRMGKDSQ
jgi:hypothetical protein